MLCCFMHCKQKKVYKNILIQKKSQQSRMVKILNISKPKYCYKTELNDRSRLFTLKNYFQTLLPIFSLHYFSYIYKVVLTNKQCADYFNNLQKRMGKKVQKQANQKNDKGSNVHQNAQQVLSDQMVDQNNQIETGNVGRWNNQEHQIFLQYYRETKMDWKAIAQRIRGRSAQQVRSHAQKFQAREAKRLQKLMDRNRGKQREEQYGSAIATRLKAGTISKKKFEPLKTKIHQKKRQVNNKIKQHKKKTHKKLKPIEQPTDDIQERNLIQENSMIALDNISEEKTDIIIPIVYKLDEDMSKIQMEHKIISYRDYETFLNLYGKKILKHINQIFYPSFQKQTPQQKESEQKVKVVLKSFTLVNDCELNRAAYLHLLRPNQIQTDIRTSDTLMDEQK